MAVPITGTIVPTDPTDIYAVIDPIWGIDGLRSVADKTARNAITTLRRRLGMFVVLQSDLSVWQLNTGTNTGTDADWTAFTGGGGGSGTVTSTSVVSTNGFAGTVATATTTPAITIETTVTGLLKGDGTGVVAASAGTDYLATAPTITLTSDVTGSGTGSFATTLATVNANVGSFGSSTAIPAITVNAKGLVTAASTSAVIAPAGTLTGTTLASNVVTSSLTTVGTIGTGTWAGTTIAVAHGGTGDTSLTAYAVMCGGTTSTAALQQVSGLGSSGDVLTSNGASALPTWQPGGGGTGTITPGNTGNLAYYTINGGTTLAGETLSAAIDGYFGSAQGDVLYRDTGSWAALAPSTSGLALLTGGASANPAWGTVAIAAGGTGQTTATAAFDALSPATTLGDTIYFGASHNVRLAGNITTAKAFLTQTGAGASSAAPVWAAIVAADLPAIAATTLFANPTGGSAAPEAVTLGNAGSFSGTVLNFAAVRTFTAILGQGAAVATGTNAAGNYLICSNSGTFKRWDLSAVTPPVGASLVIDVMKSANQGSTWTSLWASNPSNRPTLATTVNNGGGTSFDTTTYSAGDWLRFDIITVGSSTPGQNVTLEVLSWMNQ